MIKRILDCTKSDFEQMSAEDLKKSIYLAEGRTVLTQSCNPEGMAFAEGMTNVELEAAFGADLLLLNVFSLDESSPFYGFKQFSLISKETQTLTLRDIKNMVNRPIGVGLECVNPKNISEDDFFLKGREISVDNLNRAIDAKVDFIVMGANPGVNSTHRDIIEATKLAAKTVKGKMLIFAGRWENGVYEKVLGDPVLDNTKDLIKEFIDAGADVINFPAPGSRKGITVDAIRDLITFVHRYSPETLAMSFINSSLEGTDVDTMRILSIKSKETGADIHALGDAGLSGVALPENILQHSLSIKGRRHTYKRMAVNNR